MMYLFEGRYEKMLKEEELTKRDTIVLETSLLGYCAVGYDFKNLIRAQKFAKTERTKCETTYINEEQVNKEGLICAQSSMSKLKHCMYSAAYKVTALKKSSWYDGATDLNEKSQKIPMFYPIKESVCQNLYLGLKARLPGLGDFEFNATKEVLIEMNVGRTDAEFVEKISKTFMKVGDEKGVNYVYPVDWINPKGETQKSNIMIILKFSWEFWSLKLGKQMKEHGYILKTL